MIAIWYCFKGDQLCLQQSVRSFRISYPDGVIVICDDEKKPCDDKVIQEISPHEYRRRAWDSLGNLNGWECIRQMLRLQSEMHDLYPKAKGSYKIDCDTIITENDWHDHSRVLSGLDLGTDSFMTGCVRYMRKDAPLQIMDFIASRWRWESYPVPEDRGIVGLALQLWGADIECIPWHNVAHSYNFSAPVNEMQKRKVVCFGNRQNITRTNGKSSRDYAAEMMSNQLDLYDCIT